MIRARSLRAAPVLAVVLGASACAGAPIVHAAGPAGGPERAAPSRPASGRAEGSSLGILFGVGWYDNTDFNRDLELNGIDPIENGFEYGLQYRRRVSRWFSIGAELGRMDGRTNPPVASESEFGIATTPLLFDVFVHPVRAGNASLTLFGGVGPLIATRLSQTFPTGDVLDGRKTGFCTMGGAEGEVRFGPNVGFFLRGLTRRAKTRQIEVDDGSGLNPVVYDVDFDGVAVTFGPRWYFGNGY